MSTLFAPEVHNGRCPLASPQATAVTTVCAPEELLAFQSISCTPRYRSYSHEEIRLAHYNKTSLPFQTAQSRSPHPPAFISNSNNSANHPQIHCGQPLPPPSHTGMEFHIIQPTPDHYKIDTIPICECFKTSVGSDLAAMLTQLLPTKEFPEKAGLVSTIIGDRNGRCGCEGGGEWALGGVGEYPSPSSSANGQVALGLLLVRAVPVESGSSTAAAVSKNPAASPTLAKKAGLPTPPMIFFPADTCGNEPEVAAKQQPSLGKQVIFQGDTFTVSTQGSFVVDPSLAIKPPAPENQLSGMNQQQSDSVATSLATSSSGTFSPPQQPPKAVSKTTEPSTISKRAASVLDWPIPLGPSIFKKTSFQVNTKWPTPVVFQTPAPTRSESESSSSTKPAFEMPRGDAESPSPLIFQAPAPAPELLSNLHRSEPSLKTDNFKAFQDLCFKKMLREEPSVEPGQSYASTISELTDSGPEYVIAPTPPDTDSHQESLSGFPPNSSGPPDTPIQPAAAPFIPGNYFLAAAAQARIAAEEAASLSRSSSQTTPVRSVNSFSSNMPGTFIISPLSSGVYVASSFGESPPPTLDQGSRDDLAE